MEDANTPDCRKPKEKRLLVICGPTATGKTKLGIELARKFKGEIVSADSRQVYRGMDVGTGKDLRANSKFEMFERCSKIPRQRRAIRNSKQIQNSNFQIGYYKIGGVKIWLLDLVEPDCRFNVADYKRCADLVIENIWQRGKLPILVGGTGFYIKALVDGIETIGVEPDWELRRKLQSCKVSELQRTLEDLDPERSQGMNESDRQNLRRLVRAIEIAKNQNLKIKDQNQNLKFKANYLFIGLKVPNEILYQRIDQRVGDRVKVGIEDEIRRLLEKGYTWENSALGTTLAYREWQDYFDQVSQGENELNEIKKEVIQKWKFDEHDYARRQMTWFKKDKRINWFDITKDNFQNEVEKLVRSWYSKLA